MSKILYSLIALTGLGIAGSAAAAQTLAATPFVAPISEEAYNAARKDADAQYNTDKSGCASLNSNAKDICLAQAKGKAEVTKADAEAAFRNTPKARESARVARAEAAYHVATEKCDDLAGNPKDVCVKEAKAGLVTGKAEAKVDRVANETRKEGADKLSEARTEAKAETRDAKYKIALEKCDSFAGDMKTMCVTNAKADFGKS